MSCENGALHSCPIEHLHGGSKGLGHLKTGVGKRKEWREKEVLSPICRPALPK